MPRSLADGKTKFTLLTTKPADPENPTVTELNAGLHFEKNVLASDFLWGATDSDKVAEKALETENNANALGASNFQAGFTVFRYFDATTGAPDPTEDAKFAAVRAKGTELWGYSRKTGKKAGLPWGDDDEIYLGAYIVTDEPQPPSDLGGYIKYRVPAEVQEAWPWISAAAATP
jgi:hypothetical protein